MSEDEQQIRQLITRWMDASKAGDVEQVLSLMTEDAVFLQPGQPVMRKTDFAIAARAQSAAGAPQFDASSTIQEITVCGDWAFMWTHLSVSVTPAGAAVIKRAGHTLTVLCRQHGRWLLARDANLLMPVAP